MNVLYDIVTDLRYKNTWESRGYIGVISYLDLKYVTKRFYVMHKPVDT